MKRTAVLCAMLLAACLSLASVRFEPTDIQLLSRWANHPVTADGRSIHWSALPAQYEVPGLSVAAVNDNAFLYVRLVSSGSGNAGAPEHGEQERGMQRGRTGGQMELAARVLPPDPEEPGPDGGLPEDAPATDPLDLPFGEGFDAESLGSLLDLLSLEEWTLAGMNMAEWLPEVGALSPEPRGFLQTNSLEGSNSICLLRIPLAEPIHGGSEKSGRRTGSLVLEFTQPVSGPGLVRDARWERAPRSEGPVDGGNSWEVGESGPPVLIQSSPQPEDRPAWLRVTVELAETPDTSPGAR